MNYWIYFGFQNNPGSQVIIEKIASMKAKKERMKLSQAKCALVELLRLYNDNHYNIYIEFTVEPLKQLLTHAVIVNQNNYWIFISQLEVYYEYKAIDDVAFVTKSDTFVDELIVKMERQTNEACKVLGGGFGGTRIDEETTITPFLGVGVPSSLAADENYILFGSNSAVSSHSYLRMLRDYQRKNSPTKWCFKSSVFTRKSFCTPEPSDLHLSSDGFVISLQK